MTLLLPGFILKRIPFPAGKLSKKGTFTEKLRYHIQVTCNYITEIIMGDDQEKATPGGEQEKKEERDGEVKDGNQQLKELWSGTARLGASFGQVFANLGDIFSGREHVLMVRVNDTMLERVDQLVASGMVKSRSESAAYLMAKGINAEYEMFNRISEKVDEINKLREELKDIVDKSASFEEPQDE
jgi:hypothetical protein